MAALTDVRSVTSTRWKIARPWFEAAIFLGGRAAIHFVDIGDHDRKSVCSQARGDCPSDAAGRAGNNRSIALI